METYSNTNMTKPEDKLVAISGLAKEVRKNTVDFFWRQCLEKRPDKSTSVASSDISSIRRYIIQSIKLVVGLC